MTDKTTELVERVYDALPRGKKGEPYYSLTAIRLILGAAGHFTLSADNDALRAALVEAAAALEALIASYRGAVPDTTAVSLVWAEKALAKVRALAGAGM